MSSLGLRRQRTPTVSLGRAHPLLVGTGLGRGREAPGSLAGRTRHLQLGSAAVPVVLGTVFAATDSFFAAFATLAAGPLLGALLMFDVRERAHR
jgi:hypothetical protein